MSDSENQASGVPRSRDGRAFSGVCDDCGNEIYTFSDHGDCLWGMMDS